MADLVIGRLILGIPDNHEANFMLSDSKVVSIDHAFYSNKKKDAQSPFDFDVEFYSPQLPYVFFDMKSVDGVKIDAIPVILSYASDKFKNRIRKMSVKNFEKIPKKYHGEIAERIEHMQAYLYNLENKKFKKQ